MTKEYVGVKCITAWPEEKDGNPGYAVKYEDGYVSWSPKATFEKFYMPLGDTREVTTELEEGFAEALGDYPLGANMPAEEADHQVRELLEFLVAWGQHGAPILPA